MRHTIFPLWVIFPYAGRSFADARQEGITYLGTTRKNCRFRIDTACKQVRKQGESGPPAAWRSRRYSAVPSDHDAAGHYFPSLVRAGKRARPATTSSLSCHLPLSLPFRRNAVDERMASATFLRDTPPSSLSAEAIP
jgi:hypothetical protein